jgi:hypothetical protein
MKDKGVTCIVVGAQTPYIPCDHDKGIFSGDKNMKCVECQEKYKDLRK